MSLNYEMARYTELTGEDGTKVSVSRLGGYLDGYDKGRADAMDELINALCEELDKGYIFMSKQQILHFAEQIKEQNKEKK